MDQPSTDQSKPTLESTSNMLIGRNQQKSQVTGNMSVVPAPPPPTGSASALCGSIFASVIPTRPWRDGIPGSAVPVSQGNAPWRRPGKAPIGKTGLQWWTWVPFSSGTQEVLTSQPADLSRNSLFLINSCLCCFLTFVTVWKKDRFFDAKPQASHKHLRGFQALSNYLEMVQDYDDAERLLIEVPARPEHYSAAYRATLTARTNNVSN